MPGKFYKKIFFVMLFSAGLCLGQTEARGSQDRESRAKSLAYYTMGVVYDLQGLNEKAVEEFSRSAEFDDNYAVHLRLGADYARLGRLEDAGSELRQALEYDPSNVQARYLLALIFSTQKQFDKAADEYEKILTSFSQAEPENVEIYGYLGQLYYSQHQYDKAIKQFEIMLSLDTENTDVMFLLGSLYLEAKKKDKAIEIFSRAIQYDPNNDPCLNSLGYTYAEEGKKLDEAKALVERAVQLDPDNGAYLDSLGWVYFQKGEYQEALLYLQKAGRYMDDPVIYRHLGEVYMKLNQHDQARKNWEKSLSLDPQQDGLKEKLNSLQDL